MLNEEEKKELSEFVRSSFDCYFHHTENIQLGPLRDRGDHWSRRIVLTCKDGGVVRVTLFGDTQEDLMVTFSDSPS